MPLQRLVGASVSRLATFPLPARRTGHAALPHPALVRDHALRPRKARVRPLGQVRRGGPRSSGKRTSPRPRPERFRHRQPCNCAVRIADRTVPRLSRPAGTRLPSLPHAALSGVSEPVPELVGSRQSPPVLSSFRRSSRTRAPSLPPRYRRSPLLRAHPPPCRPRLALAGSRWARARHRQGFPCCDFLPLPCVLAPIPRRKRVGARVAHFPTRQRPSPRSRRVGSRIGVFEACSAFTSRSGPQGR